MKTTEILTSINAFMGQMRDGNTRELIANLQAALDYQTEKLRIYEEQYKEETGKDRPELTDDELFYAHEVSLTDFDEFDLPGRPRRKQYCEVCGDLIHDNRAIERDGHTYCRRCAGEHVYYTLGAPISL